MKKVLVIHPNDRSTDFLKPIYADILNATIISGGMTRADVDQEIIKHDRIIMMGHGSPSGLFAMGQFISSEGFIISHGTVDLLKDKECIFIWCNADQFINTHDLKGLYSGMFISEVGEAYYCGLPDTPQKVVNESNDYFANELGKVSNLDLNEIYNYVKASYGILAGVNSVANYNNNRIYLA